MCCVLCAGISNLIFAPLTTLALEIGNYLITKIWTLDFGLPFAKIQLSQAFCTPRYIAILRYHHSHSYQYFRYL